jgi:hypothetical protein
MDTLGEARQRRRFLHKLLDPAWGIGGVAPGCKQRPGRAIPQIRPKFVRECREEGDIALLAAFALRDEEHLLIKIHIGHLHLHKLRHPGPGLKQRFNE